MKVGKNMAVIVIPVVAGSSPVSHPNFNRLASNPPRYCLIKPRRSNILVRNLALLPAATRGKALSDIL